MLPYPIYNAHRFSRARKEHAPNMILPGPSFVFFKLAYKPHSVRAPGARGDHLSRVAVAGNLMQPTRAFDGTSSPAAVPDSCESCPAFALLGLAPGGVCLASAITDAAGGLLHHRFTLAGRNFQQAMHFSVALAVGLPRPAVSRHHALWSADFPQPPWGPRSPGQLDTMIVALTAYFWQKDSHNECCSCLQAAAGQG